MIYTNRMKEFKRHIRAFMQLAYTDERLTWLLAHARSGKLSYHSCCCFVGIVTATHKLRGAYALRLGDPSVDHYELAKLKWGSAASWAELGFLGLGNPRGFRLSMGDGDDDARRRRVIIPMILAEQRRRDQVRDRVKVQAHIENSMKNAIEDMRVWS
jgi:hypothetical protein